MIDDFLQNMLTRVNETNILLEHRQVTVVPLPRYGRKLIYVIFLVNASGPEAPKRGLVMGASIALGFFDALWLGGDASDATAWDRLTLRWPTVPGGTTGRTRLAPVQHPITMLFVNHAHDKETEFQQLATRLLPWLNLLMGGVRENGGEPAREYLLQYQGAHLFGHSFRNINNLLRMNVKALR